jgi:putative ABC transport system permease protein
VKNVGISPMEVRELARATTVTDLVEYHSMPFVILGGTSRSGYRPGWSRPRSSRRWECALARAAVREGEDLPGAPPVLLLSYKYWQTHHGGDPGVVGRSFTMNDRVHTVVGVLPNIPQYPAENDVYMPVDSCPFRRAATWDQVRNVRGLTVFAHLAPGVSLARARASSR